MRIALAIVLALVMHSALSQETSIRILGVYPTHLSLDQGRINAHLIQSRHSFAGSGEFSRY